MKYVEAKVTFQEFPNEISLCFNISNCPHKCEGCHSPYLSENVGKVLDTYTINKLINRYKDIITLVGFLGGDWNPRYIVKLARTIKNTTGLKVGWYCGCNYIPIESRYYRFFDYIKIGNYNKRLGPLTSRTTNQIMYKIVKFWKWRWLKNITHVFWK